VTFTVPWPVTEIERSIGSSVGSVGGGVAVATSSPLSVKAIVAIAATPAATTEAAAIFQREFMASLT
jgi:homoserine acetyltransferase